MWFIGVEVEQETSAPPPKKNPGSAPDVRITTTTVGSIFLTSPVLGPFSLRTSTVPLPKPCTSQSKVHPFAWSYNQLQKYLRHCTPVHVAYFGWTDLPIILCLWSPPTPIKVASNYVEPCSRLEGTILNGREEGGEYFISQTSNHQQFNSPTYTQIHTPTMVQKGGRVDGTGPCSFLYVAVFWNDFTFSGKPLIFLTRWGIFYGWWRCWRPVTSPTMVAILAAILDFTKN